MVTHKCAQVPEVFEVAFYAKHPTERLGRRGHQVLGEPPRLHDATDQTGDGALRKAVDARVEVAGHVARHVHDDRVEDAALLAIVHLADATDHRAPVA